MKKNLLSLESDDKFCVVRDKKIILLYSKKQRMKAWKNKTWSLKIYMIVNFRIYRISQDTRKLIHTSTLIIIIIKHEKL